MLFSVSIAVLVAVCYAAPLENPSETVTPIAIASTTEPITKQPEQQPHIEDHPPVSNNLNQPEAKPFLHNNDKRHPIQDNIKPESDPSPPAHHVQEHELNKHPEEPTIHPTVSEQKPGLEEVSDEDIGMLQALMLMITNYEMELLAALQELENKNAHNNHEHKQSHQHHNNHGYSHGHYTPNKDDLQCDCESDGNFESKH